MDITIFSSFLPHNDPEASLAFYRDTLGFEVRLGYEIGVYWDQIILSVRLNTMPSIIEQSYGVWGGHNFRAERIDKLV